MTHKFFMPMIPPTITAQQKKINFKTKQLYEPEELKTAKAKLKSGLIPYSPVSRENLASAGLKSPEEAKPLFSCPTRLIVRWLFPIPKSKRFSVANGQYKDTKPDTDNLQKMFKDLLEDLKFVRNDAIICSELVEKFWADTPGIYVELQEIHQELPTKKGR